MALIATTATETALNEARLARFANHPNDSHPRHDLTDQAAVDYAFATFKPQRLVNLVTQANDSNSLQNPRAYMQSQLVGLINILQT